MEKTLRFKAVIRHLCLTLGVKNQKELGKKLGYSSESAFSQVVNGIAPTPDVLLEKLKSLDCNLNIDWLTTGEGEMLMSEGHNSTTSGSGNITQQNTHGDNTVKTDDRLISIIEEQSHQLTTSQEQITQLLTILSQKL